MFQASIQQTAGEVVSALTLAGVSTVKGVSLHLSGSDVLAKVFAVILAPALLFSFKVTIEVIQTFIEVDSMCHLVRLSWSEVSFIRVPDLGLSVV